MLWNLSIQNKDSQQIVQKLYVSIFLNYNNDNKDRANIVISVYGLFLLNGWLPWNSSSNFYCQGYKPKHVNNYYLSSIVNAVVSGCIFIDREIKKH